MNVVRLMVLGAVAALAAWGQAYSTPVRDVDNAARTAVTLSGDCTSAGSAAICSFGYVVPAGMRLVVLTVNGQIPVQSGGQLPFVRLFPTLDGVKSYLFYAPKVRDDVAHYAWLHEQTWVAADSTPYVDVYGVAHASVSLAGYLIRK